MIVLISGGAGFIGSHLCEFLLSQNYGIICVDNLITGNIANIQHLIPNKNFKLIKHDITKPLQIATSIDYVLHFASPASPVDFQEFPIETLRAGSLGTFNTLEIAKEKKASFLLASTAEVYGDPLQNPQQEEYWGNVNPIGPRSVYDEAKRFAEALTMAYHTQYGLDVKIARIFNTYGPRMREDDGRVVPTFVTRALKGKPLIVFGDGSQTRSFCYVSDLIQGIYKLMLQNVNKPVNLGNPEEITILELAHKILKTIGSKSRIIYKPLRTDDPNVRRPDISRAQELLHWSPQVQLDQGLKKTIEWTKRQKVRFSEQPGHLWLKPNRLESKGIGEG